MALELAMRVHPTGTGLVPATEAELAVLADLASRSRGAVLKVRISKPRQTAFHNKGMALFRYLFELWEPAGDSVDGVPVAKDFDAFRKDLTIAAGYYRQVFLPSGGFTLEAKSLAWGAMDGEEFDRVYSRVIDVGLRMLGKADHLSRAQVDNAVERLVHFA